MRFCLKDVANVCDQRGRRKLCLRQMNLKSIVFIDIKILRQETQFLLFEAPQLDLLYPAIVRKQKTQF